jgi:hypothetical protein
MRLDFVNGFWVQLSELLTILRLKEAATLFWLDRSRKGISVTVDEASCAVTHHPFARDGMSPYPSKQGERTSYPSRSSGTTLAANHRAEQFPGRAVKTLHLHLLDWEVVVRAGIDLYPWQQQGKLKVT